MVEPGLQLEMQLLNYMEPYQQDLVSLSLYALDGLTQVYDSRLTTEKIEMRRANSPSVAEVEDFGIFREDFNPFT